MVDGMKITKVKLKCPICGAENEGTVQSAPGRYTKGEVTMQLLFRCEECKTVYCVQTPFSEIVKRIAIKEQAEE